MNTGVDVSYAQGNVNWGHIDTDFAIIRAGYGREVSQKDNQFENNYAGCKSNKIPVGCYWYSYALTVEDAKKEAKACLEIIKGKTFEYPIYFDVEESSQAKLPKTQMSAIVKAFCDELERAGYWVGIYSYASFLKEHLSIDVLERYAVWVAHTGVSAPNYDKPYGMWQYSHTGHVNGISGNVDVNKCYVDYPTLIKKAGLNGFKKVNKVTSDNKVASEKKPKKSYAKGTKLTLKNTKLYASATDKSSSGTLSGTYYIYDGECINGRYRITNAKSSVGKTPVGTYVTGFVNKSDL
jgi:GH25 family lysozyme M1 (1,4-beta-N-acetylmuramidase)